MASLTAPSALDGRGPAPPPINLLTLNIRNDRDKAEGSPERTWNDRKTTLIEKIDPGSNDFMAFQEVTSSQLADLQGLLDKVWSQVGEYPGGQESRPIFYKTDRFEQQHSKTIWLSETPDVESQSWGSASYRTATLATFKDKQNSDEPVHVINAHLEWHSGGDEGEEARIKSAGVIRRESKKFFEENERQLGKDGGAVVLLGDFTTVSALKEPAGDDTLGFLDTYDLYTAHHPLSESESRTWTGFAYNDPDRDAYTRIDYVMLGTSGDMDHGRGGWSPTDWHVIYNWVDDGNDPAGGWYWSDHRAVKATISKL